MSGLDIAGGRVLDPGQGIDATATVSIADGVITGVDVTEAVRRATMTAQTQMAAARVAAAGRAVTAAQPVTAVRAAVTARAGRRAIAR